MHTNQQTIPLHHADTHSYIQTTVLPLMVFFMTVDKTDNVTPYVFFHDGQKNPTMLPLMFFFMTVKKN